MTQPELATRANISLRHLQRIERGSAVPSAPTFDAIGMALGVDPRELRFVDADV